MRRAVITGTGVVSAFGIGREAFWDGLRAGRSAIGPIRLFDVTTFPTRVAGEVPLPARVDPEWLAARLGVACGRTALEHLTRRGGLRDRKLVLALLAAAEAWRHAGCGAAEQAAACCLAVGLEQGFLEDFAAIFDGQRLDWQREGAAGLPDVRFRAPVDLVAEGVRAVLGLSGRCTVHVSACAAGAMAIAHGAALIERGLSEVVLCGATDSLLNPLALGGMSRIGAPSPRNAADACRPFDRRRDGLVIGEGAAIFVLEAEERAATRGARALARIEGWGTSQDGYRPTAPLPDGSAAARAIRQALTRGALEAGAIGYVNAHGTGTPLNDPAEARALHAVFGERTRSIPVSSIKGAVGHLMAASGAIEIAACLLPFEHDTLPGTAHHLELDPECELDVIGDQPRSARVDHVLSSSFGFGGQNAAVVLGRPSCAPR